MTELRNVLPINGVLNRNVIRDDLADGLNVVALGRSDRAVGDTLNWDEKTVRNVRNRTNTLSLELFTSAGVRTAGLFYQPWLARQGMRQVAVANVRSSDAGKAAALAQALSALIQLGGGEVSDAALALQLPVFTAAKEALFELCARGTNPLKAVA